MEKRIPITIILLLTLLFSTKPAIAQEKMILPKIRIQLWTLTEDDPSLGLNSQPGEKIYMPAIRKLQDIAPFILEGMIYSWEFSYTPSDKLRAVNEYFEINPLTHISIDDPALKWTESSIVDSKLSCWLEYERSPQMIALKRSWNAVRVVKSSGIGYGKLSEGNEGLKNAITESIKLSIRSYAQSITKNKPKEISGRILLNDKDPRIYIKNGQYVADLDFFLHIGKIEQYSVY